MKTSSWLFTPAYRPALAAACLLVLAGCGGESSAGEDDDHVGHVIPAHKPKTFPAAVHRLRELNGQIGREVGAGPAASSSGEKTVHIALDIANWLPEIAADSDMPVTPWNVVDAGSELLAADYQAILSNPSAASAATELENAGKVITELEALLAAADPRWFVGAPQK
jgi:hypothetical protein